MNTTIIFNVLMAIVNLVLAVFIQERFKKKMYSPIFLAFASGFALAVAIQNFMKS